MQVASILFKELEALKMQLQDAKEEMVGDGSKDESLSLAAPRKGADDPEETMQLPSNAHATAGDLVFHSPAKSVDSFDAASLETLTGRLHAVMRVVHTWISLSQLPETTLAAGDSLKLQQQQQIQDYILALRPDQKDYAREADPLTPGFEGRNPDDPWVSPILKPDKQLYASIKVVVLPESCFDSAFGLLVLTLLLDVRPQRKYPVGTIALLFSGCTSRHACLMYAMHE